MGLLHACFAVMLVINDTDRKICRGRNAGGRQRATAHQHLAVARQHDNPAVRLSARQAEPRHSSAAHTAPEIKVIWMVTGCRGIPGGGAQTCDHQHIATVAHDPRDDISAVQRNFFLCSHYLRQSLKPIMR